MLIRFLAAAAVLCAQQSVPVPKIGVIDFYGLRKADKARVLKALEVKVGDPLPKSKGEIEQQIELVNGVVRASLEAVCCEDGNAILYVGILEKGQPTFDYREWPHNENVKLPEEIVDTWHAFMEQLQLAVAEGKANEDLTKGHSLMQYAPAREQQEKFPALVKTHMIPLKRVLRESVDETERAIAAYVLAYAPDKKDIVDDLQYAMRDPDDGVRNNAMRSLAAVTVLANLSKDPELKISPTWFVEQMNSILWTDRNKAAFALVPLTENRDAATLALLKDRALDAMVDMARWKSLGHSLQGFILLARTAGWEEKKIQDTWTSREHLAAVDAILKEFSAKKK
jgi:hypothetical protein